MMRKATDEDLVLSTADFALLFSMSLTDEQVQQGMDLAKEHEVPMCAMLAGKLLRINPYLDPSLFRPYETDKDVLIGSFRGFCSRGDSDRAEQCLEQLREKGCATTPTYNILMGMYKSKRDLAGVRKIYQLMRKRKVSADSYTYGILIQAVGAEVSSVKDKNMAVAEGLLDEADRSGLLNKEICTNLAMVYAALAPYAAPNARRLMQRMSARGIELSVPCRAALETATDTSCMVP
eukprot:Sspe_Gene.25635::Locus_10346_Transcript_1_1_Confidence_1.000_Length_1383::g.25635::m.25635